MTVENVAVIIRSVGERTEALCYQILTQQVPAEHIAVVHEHPFAKALDRGFEIGLDLKLPWTLCVDADVLLRADAAFTLMQRIEGAAASVFEVQGKALDKFFGGPMPAGNHLYRTSLLDKARRVVPFDGRSLRPETYVIKEMAKEGHPWIQTEDVIGLHDYEQYYRDIVRKMFVRARKHARFMPVLAQFYRRMSSLDNDYSVGLWGLQVELDIDHQNLLDANAYTTWVDALLHQHNLEEKLPLDLARFGRGFVEETLSCYEAPAEYYQAVRMVQLASGKITWPSRILAAAKRRWHSTFSRDQK